MSPHFSGKGTEGSERLGRTPKDSGRSLAPRPPPRALHRPPSPAWPQPTWATLICFVHLGHVCESMFEELRSKVKRFEVNRLSLSPQGASPGCREGGVGPLGLGWTRMSTQLLRRDGRAPCLKCPQSPTHVPGGNQAQDHILQAFREVHPFATGTDGASGSGKHTRAPCQQIKCSLAGRTWKLVLSCPLNPDAWSHLEKTLTVAIPGSWALTEGASWPRGPWAAVAGSSHGPFGLP